MRRTASGKAKKGMTLSQFLRHAGAMAFAAPGSGGEGLQRGPSRIGVLGSVEGAQLRHDELAIGPGHEFERMADQMDDAGLNDRAREDRLDRFREAFQAVDNGDENVADAAVPELVHHLEPELGALGVLDPEAEHVLGPVGGDAQRNIDRLVANEPPRRGSSP